MTRKATIPDEEPTRMSRVEGLIKEIWPDCVSYVTWHEGPQPIRHLVVRFGKRASQRVAFEGAGATWREAFIEVEKQRLAHNTEGK
jgi:hypothetical protein